MDIALTQFINNLSGRVPALDLVMIAITNYGIYFLVAATVLLWWKRYQRAEARNACLVAGLSFLGSLALNQALLLFLHRIRPYDAGVSHLLITPNPDWSFPSDHATAAAAIIVGLWLKKLPRIAVLLGIVAALICFSRIYVGMHYVSDVVGGVAIGTLAAFVVSQLYRDESWYARRVTNIF